MLYAAEPRALLKPTDRIAGRVVVVYRRHTVLHQVRPNGVVRPGEWIVAVAVVGPDGITRQLLDHISDEDGDRMLAFCESAGVDVSYPWDAINKIVWFSLRVHYPAPGGRGGQPREIIYHWCPKPPDVEE